MNYVIIAVGAVIVIAEGGLVGWLVHRWLVDHAPGIAVWIPRDGGAIMGFVIGLNVVIGWALGK